jgi:hypothetical protein
MASIGGNQNGLFDSNLLNGGFQTGGLNLAPEGSANALSQDGLYGEFTNTAQTGNPQITPNYGNFTSTYGPQNPVTQSRTGLEIAPVSGFSNGDPGFGINSSVNTSPLTAAQFAQQNQVNTQPPSNPPANPAGNPSQNSVGGAIPGLGTALANTAAALASAFPNGVPGNGANPSGAQPLSQMNQNWMTANAGPFANLMNFMRSGGGSQLNSDPMNIDWTNFSNGNPEHITRALGVIQQGGADALARILGGTAVDSPFATFGTNQRDRFIRMPNGQMIDASALGQSLQQASRAQDPFSALSATMDLYRSEQQRYNPSTSTDAIDMANRGQLNTNTPANWNPSTFAGGNPTFRPQGAAQGNPSNPGMGTSNPVGFQNGQIDYRTGQNGFPVFNFAQNNPGLPNNNNGLYNPPSAPPTAPASGPQTPPAALVPPPAGSNPPATPPQGLNTNSQYFLPGSMSNRGGLYDQGNRFNSTTGGGNTSTTNTTNGAAGMDGQQGLFGTNGSRNNTTPGNLPNGAQVIGR